MERSVANCVSAVLGQFWGGSETGSASLRLH